MGTYETHFWCWVDLMLVSRLRLGFVAAGNVCAGRPSPGSYRIGRIRSKSTIHGTD
jgi:hypothetical protein